MVLLQTLKLTLFEDGYAMIVSIPATNGTYPVTAVGSPLKPHEMVSVVAVPVAVVVTAVAHAAEDIELVPIADVPLATVVLPFVLTAWTQSIDVPFGCNCQNPPAGIVVEHPPPELML